MEVVMAGNFIGNKRKKTPNLLAILALVFVSSGFQSILVKAEIISYPAQLEACWLPILNSNSPFPLTANCQLSFVSRTGYTNSKCNPNMVTNFSNITCGLVDPLNGNTYTYQNIPANPVYTCMYGGKNPNWFFLPSEPQVGAEFAPSSCEITVDNTKIIPAKNLGKDINSCTNTGLYSGNPVHNRTGNKYTLEFDYDSQFIQFTRSYNSKQNKLDRNIGIHWRHSFSSRLVLNPAATPPITFAERPDGKTIHFRLVGSQWISDADISDQLVETSGIGWELITIDDAIEIYDTSGRLLSITNRNGRAQTLSYDANGHLSTVTDDTGRALSFTHDGSGRIKTMTDPAGGIYQYGYNASGNLTSITYPDGKTRTYHYNDPLS